MHFITNGYKRFFKDQLDRSKATCSFKYTNIINVLSSQDVDSYAMWYSGLAKINRLLFVAAHCPTLKIEALRLALSYTQTTYNTQMYQIIQRKLTEAV